MTGKWSPFLALFALAIIAAVGVDTHLGCVTVVFVHRTFVNVNACIVFSIETTGTSALEYLVIESSLNKSYLEVGAALW